MPSWSIDLYSLVDANWNHMKNGDLEKLTKYAGNKNIGLLIWYNSGGKHNVVEEEPRNLMDHRKARRQEFDRISKMGIIKQYTDLLEDAAEFKLVVNFHGCTFPKGWRRRMLQV